MEDKAIMPEDVWQLRHRDPGFFAGFWLILAGWRARLRGADAPTVDATIALNLQVAQMALDTAKSLKWNGRIVNASVLTQAALLLDIDLCAEDAETIGGAMLDS